MLLFVYFRWPSISSLNNLFFHGFNQAMQKSFIWTIKCTGFFFCILYTPNRNICSAEFWCCLFLKTFGRFCIRIHGTDTYPWHKILSILCDHKWRTSAILRCFYFFLKAFPVTSKKLLSCRCGAKAIPQPWLLQSVIQNKMLFFFLEI